MAKRPRTPSEIKKTREKKTYSFSLIEAKMEELKKLADAGGVPASELVDEAISYYLVAIKEVKK